MQMHHLNSLVVMTQVTLMEMFFLLGLIRLGLAEG